MELWENHIHSPSCNTAIGTRGLLDEMQIKCNMSNKIKNTFHFLPKKGNIYYLIAPNGTIENYNQHNLTPTILRYLNTSVERNRITDENHRVVVIVNMGENQW